jgi:hypothetical protein
MKIFKFLILTGILISTFETFGQKKVDELWSNKYRDKEYSQWDYISIAEKVNWNPKTTGMYKGSFALFEKIFLEVCKDSRVLQQLKIDGWYYCSLDHDYLFERYNKNYNKISKEIWDEYCPILYNLMALDK